MLAAATLAAGLVVIATPAARATTAAGYKLSVIAGRPGVGTGTPQQTNEPYPDGVDVDGNGNVYIADRRGYVEKVAPDGTLTIVAGNGNIHGIPVPGTATASPLAPNDVAVSAAGDVFVADGQGYVEKVTPDGTLSIVAGREGTGAESVADGEPATWSYLDPIVGVDVDDAGSLYLADQSDTIEKVAPNGTLTVIGGNVTGPAGWAAAETGTGYIGVDGIAVAPGGDPVYISADKHIYRLSGGAMSNFAGDGSTNQSNWPAGLPAGGAPAVSGPVSPEGVGLDHDGNVLFADGSSVGRITPTGTMTVLARHTGTSDPAAAQSSTMLPNDVAADGSGNVFIADDAGFVDMLSSVGYLSTVVGDPEPMTPIEGPATQSPLRPNDVAYDAAGNLYVADEHGYIEKVTPAGSLTVVAGNGDTTDGPVPGPAGSSPLHPTSITVDTTGNVYAGGFGYVVKVTPAGVLSILYSGARPGLGGGTIWPGGMAVDAAGNVYLADGAHVDRLSTSGVMTTVAGSGDLTVGAPQTGPALSSAIEANDVAVDSSGDVFIAEHGSGIDEVTPDGNLVHYAGWTAGARHLPGPALSRHMEPTSVAVDGAGNVYVTDLDFEGRAETGTYVEKIGPGGWLSLAAGNGDTVSDAVVGWATASPLQPGGLAVDGSGRIAAAVADGGYVVGLDQEPTSVPSAPTNPSAQAGASSATVTFDASYDTGGLPVTSYTVSDGSGHSCSPTTLLAPGAGRMSCEVAGLQPGTPVSLHVVAANANGPSAGSVATNVVTPYTKAGAPTGTAATLLAGGAHVTWTAPDDDGWSPITGYRVYATDTLPGSTAFAVCPDVVSSAATSCTANDLSDGHSYTFVVAARNAAGTGPTSAPSTALAVADRPGVPIWVSATAADGSALVSWFVPADDGSPITGYTITAGPGGATTSVSGTAQPGHSMSAVVGGLTNGTAYTFTVTATNAIGTSDPSGASAPVTPTAASVPPPALVWRTSSFLSVAHRRQRYRQVIRVAGGAGASDRFAVVGGRLPAALTLGHTTGGHYCVISGRARRVGRFAVKIRATDAQHHSIVRWFHLIVR